MRTSLAPKQRWLVRGIRAFAALLLLSVFSAPAVAANNILVLIADDFGIDSSPLYNTNPTARFPPMPNVNALAAQGVRFSNVYSYPTCSPTRSAMLTGRYGFRTGIALAINPENTVALAHSEVTLPEVLSAQTTYRHAAFGKWHLSSSNTDPNTRGGWSHFSGAIGGELPDYFSWPRVVNGTRFPNHPVYATTANVDDALTWISQQGASPWFVWIAFNAAHTPLHKPPNALHSYDSLPGTATHIASNPRPYFEAMIEALDTEIGRLLSGIDRNNTTIIFTADNGTLGQIIQPPYAASRGKGTLYEGGTRVPLIAAGAGVANPGRVNDTLVASPDLFFTILELAGVAPEQAIGAGKVRDSISLVPILNNTVAEITRTVLTEHFGGGLNSAAVGRALRRGRYKLIQFRSGTNRFYDLQTDPQEQTNLLAGTLTKQQQSALAELEAQSTAWREAPSLTPEKSGTQFSVRFAPVQRYTYTLERRTSLSDGTWKPVTSLVAPDSDNVVTLLDTSAPAEQGFYRVQAAMP